MKQLIFVILCFLTFSSVPAVTESFEETSLSSDDELSPDILSAGEDLTTEDIRSMMGAEIESEKALFPVQGGGPIISKFGDPRDGGRRRHEGIDIGAKRGTPVIASWGGVVVYSTFDPLGGWAVKIKHKNGLSTYYAHLNERSHLRAGQTIGQGDYVGPVGNSGDAKFTVTHLHFGTYKGGVAVNPSRYLFR